MNGQKVRTKTTHTIRDNQLQRINIPVRFNNYTVIGQPHAEVALEVQVTQGQLWITAVVRNERNRVVEVQHIELTPAKLGLPDKRRKE